MLVAAEWIQEYRQVRPGAKKLQAQVDRFMAEYDRQEEEVRVVPQATPALQCPVTSPGSYVLSCADAGSSSRVEGSTGTRSSGSWTRRGWLDSSRKEAFGRQQGPCSELGTLATNQRVVDC